MISRRCSIPGWSGLHLRKPDHSAKDVAKILDKLPEKYPGRIVLHRVPELLKEYPVAGYHHSSIESIQKLEGRAVVRFTSFPGFAKTRKPLITAFLVRSTTQFPSMVTARKFPWLR